MKALLISLFILFYQTAQAQANYPKLFFIYSSFYDEYTCTGKNKVSDEWVNEAFSKESYFQKLWDSSAPLLFQALNYRFKGRFTRNEYTATLSVCPEIRSFSSPLVLKVNRFLKSYQGNKPLAPESAFITLVFHELLHAWVGENLMQLKLLQKYKNEPREVINHLHLMAVESFCYRESGNNSLLKWIQNYYSEGNDAYSRAWKIVQDEGEAAFLSEFESFI